jgi:hypothetical protein
MHVPPPAVQPRHGDRWRRRRGAVWREGMLCGVDAILVPLEGFRQEVYGVINCIWTREGIYGV